MNNKLTLKEIAMLIVTAVCVIGALLTIVSVNFMGNVTPRDIMLLNVIQFILTILFSIITGHYFTKISNYEKIDTIAKGSSEKMIHLSLQIQHLKNYLLDTNDCCLEKSKEDALIIYNQRIISAAEMAGSLASSNEAFRNDWLGVVSNGMRDELEEESQLLKGYLQDAETINRLESERVKLAQQESPNVERLITEIDYRIAEISANMTVPNALSHSHIPLQNVYTEQIRQQTSEEVESGLLIISATKSLPVVTGSGKSAFDICDKENVEVRLISHPEAFNEQEVKITKGVDQNNRFNVHMSNNKTKIPAGVYTFEYTVKR